MMTISSKAELIAQLENPVFQALLAANSEEDLVRIVLEDPEDDAGYQLDEESEELDGLYLFSTPLKSNNSGKGYGTTIHVIKLFDGSDYPYRVEAVEDTPWGNGMEEPADLGDFMTLGEAADLAFHAYEHGDLALEVLAEDEVEGTYIKVPVRISIPDRDLADSSLSL